MAHLNSVVGVGATVVVVARVVVVVGVGATHVFCGIPVATDSPGHRAALHADNSSAVRLGDWELHPISNIEAIAIDKNTTPANFFAIRGSYIRALLAGANSHVLGEGLGNRTLVLFPSTSSLNSRCAVSVGHCLPNHSPSQGGIGGGGRFYLFLNERGTMRELF
jgi:hypothetical protein